LAGQEQTATQVLAKDYLRIADSFRQELGRPVLLVVRGLSGTGKTTLARRLSEVLEIVRLETDAVRREIFGGDNSSSAYGAGVYRAENRARVYAEMLIRAKELIDAGRSAIVDGTFLTTKSRIDALQLAAEGRATPLVVECHCPDDVARERIAARLETGVSLSESRPDIYSRQKELKEPDPPGVPVCHVDTTLSLPAMVQGVLARLADEWMRQQSALHR
jgi:predicted kinase